MASKNAFELAKAFGYLTELEVSGIKHCLSKLGDNLICVNIGAGSGTSGLAMIEAKKVAKLYTVDIFCGARPEGGLGNELVAFRDAGFENDPRHQQICGDSAEAGLCWKGGMVDFVFIDGNHSYEHCTQDAYAWIAHVKVGGILAFHDYDLSPWMGVTQCVNRHFLKVYPTVIKADSFIAFKMGYE